MYSSYFVEVPIPMPLDNILLYDAYLKLDSTINKQTVYIHEFLFILIIPHDDNNIFTYLSNPHNIHRKDKNSSTKFDDDGGGK